MNVFKISYKNFLHKPINAFLTVVLLSFSVALISLSFQLQKQIADKLSKNAKAVDMVVGAKGSPLQLVLSSVLHIDNPTGNIQFKEARRLMKNPLVKKAVPIAYGDNYKGYRIVGTQVKDFGSLYGLEHLKSGTYTQHALEVVIGYEVAKKTKLSLGDEFVSSHGLVSEGSEQHTHHHLKVVGVYPATNSIIDNLIVTPLASIWNLHDHDHKHQEEQHETDAVADDKEVTSVLIQFRNPMGFVQLPRLINEQTNMQAALTKFQLDRLYRFTGIGTKVIQLIAGVILCISIISIYISLYKIIKERQYELALIRVYGGNRIQLILLVFFEGLIIAILGFILGILFRYLGGVYLFNYINENYSYTIYQTYFAKIDFYLFFMIILLLMLVTLLNIRSISKIDISKILSNEK